jgi:hypothetical protein
MPTQFELGLLVGLLAGEGHFGGDGRQPQVTLRMHVRHEAIFRWLERTFPGGRVYGPYNHGGRHYLQWMARGSFLRDELAPLLDRYLSADLDRHSYDRFQLMKAHYPQLAEGPAADGDAAAPPPASAARAEDHQGPGSQSAPAATPAPAAAPAPAGTPAPDPFADLFAQLREAWPS